MYAIRSYYEIKSVASLDEENWRDVAPHEVDISRPYRIDLPSGRSIAVFFYDGPISQAIAFEGLLKDGERFWQRMSGNSVPGIRAVGTDGETYGHHFRFGEMALAYVLDQARSVITSYSIHYTKLYDSRSLLALSALDSFI